MTNLSYNASSFYLYTKRDSDNILDLNEAIVESGETFFEKLLCFQKHHEEMCDNIAKKKTYQCNEISTIHTHNEKYSYVYLVVKVGNYGLKSTLQNKDTAEVKYERSKNDADVKTFIVTFIIPKGKDVKKGMLFFQNIGNYGVKTITNEYLQRFFSELDIMLRFRSLAHSEFLQKMLEQEIYQLTLVKNEISQDDADNLGFLKKGKEKRTFSQIKFQDTEKKTFRNKLEKFIEDPNHIFELEDEKFDEVQVTFEDAQKKHRTIKLNRLENQSIVEKIPEEFVFEGQKNKIIDEEGYPIKEILMQYYETIIGDYLEKMLFTDIGSD
ncbi:MAG: hypothetical protein ACRDCC_04880 [Culicoidibacterales bacterium]